MTWQEMNRKIKIMISSLRYSRSKEKPQEAIQNIQEIYNACDAKVLEWEIACDG